MLIPLEIGKDNHEFIRRAVIDDIPLRYTRYLNSVDWEDLFSQELPLTSHLRKSIISHLSGEHSVNPLLLLAKVVMDQIDVYGYAMKSDEEFGISLKAFANELTKYDQEFDSQIDNAHTSPLEYSLRKVLSKNDGLFDDFVNICNAIVKRYDLLAKIALTKHGQILSKRTMEGQIGLQLPYAGSECWHLGATHLEGSAIDMAPSLYQR